MLPNRRWPEDRIAPLDALHSDSELLSEKPRFAITDFSSISHCFPEKTEKLKRNDEEQRKPTKPLAIRSLRFGSNATEWRNPKGF